MTEYLSFKQLVTIACRVTATDEPPVRDWGLLESALNRPQANIFGADAYPTLHEKVAALTHSLARNRALLDGNKRLAFIASYMMYSMNGHELDPPSIDEGESFVLDVAQGHLEVPEIAAILETWAKPFE